MMWILTGIVLGVLWAWNGREHPAAVAPLRTLNDTVSDYAVAVVDKAAGLFHLDPAGFARYVGVVVSVLAPAVFAAVLADAALALRNVRRALMLLLVFGSVMSYLFLPFGQATLLSVVAIVVASFVSLASGAVLLLPLGVVVAATSATAVFHVAAASDGVSTAADVLAAGAGGDPALWRVVLSVAIVAISAVALVRLAFKPGR